MGFEQYLAAREFVSGIGQPVITYIFNYLVKLQYIHASLYIIGFIFIIWFHVQIYNTVLIVYPVDMRLPVESSRETEEIRLLSHRPDHAHSFCDWHCVCLRYYLLQLPCRDLRMDRDDRVPAIHR